MSPAPAETSSLELKRNLPGEPARAFAAWTEPGRMERWFGPTEEFRTEVHEVDLRVGGRFRITFFHAEKGTRHVVTGVYKEVDRSTRLVFTWEWLEGGQFEGETLVTIRFDPAESGTEMVVAHELFPNDAVRDDHEKGWTGCFVRLEKYLGGSETEGR